MYKLHIYETCFASLKTDILLFHRCLRLVNNYKRNEGPEKDTALQEEGAGKTNIIHLLSALEAKLHLQKAQNYLRRGHAFQNDSFFELKQALLCNSGECLCSTTSS
jgi:hypothetical protein